MTQRVHSVNQTVFTFDARGDDLGQRTVTVQEPREDGDYRLDGTPVELGHALELDGRALPASLLDPVVRCVECDIKALVWSKFGPLVVQTKRCS